MLGIKDDDRIRWGSWHVGEVLRIPPGPVLTFQMDGHEKEAILDALRQAGIVIEVTKWLTPVL